MHPWHVFKMEGYLLTYYTLMSSVKERKGKQKNNTLLKKLEGKVCARHRVLCSGNGNPILAAISLTDREQQ